MAEGALGVALALLIAALALAAAVALLAYAPAGGGAVAALLSPETVRALVHTLFTGLGSTALAALLGGGLALLTALTDLRGRETMGFLFVLLLIIPPQITALAWIALVGPASPVLAPLGLAPAPGSPEPIFGPAGIVLLLGIEQAPLVFIALRAGLRALPRDLTDAARAAGAGPWRTLLSVILPLSAPALAGGLSLAFVAAIGNFGTPALLGIPGRYLVLTTEIYQHLTGFGPSALGSVTLLSLLLGALALAAVALERLLGGRLDVRATAAAGEPFALGRARPFAEAGVWLLLLALLGLPLAALLGSALVKAEGLTLGPATITLAQFRDALGSGSPVLRALWNSLRLAGGAALALAVLAAPASHLARHAGAGQRALRLALLAADLPFAMPGVVLAIACILLFLRPVGGIAFYDTLRIILAAYLMRFLPLARRPVTAALERLDPSLEEAAAISGAAPLRRFGDVTLPLIAPAVAAGALMVFLIAFNELTVSALLWSEGHETMGVIVYNLGQAGEFGQAAAVASIATAITVALMALAERAGRHRPGLLPWRD